MAISPQTYEFHKYLGQVYTPGHVVCKVLDDIGFTQEQVVGKVVLDPACGDGRFLQEVVKRIIEFSPFHELEENLKNIYGWDIDEVAVAECIKNLDEMVTPMGISVKWNIHVKNSLEEIERVGVEKCLAFNEEVAKKFDFIVGNPPYIRIQHMDKAQRKYIQKKYQFCRHGSTNIYMAFVELCYYLLNENGVCGLVVPNTFLHTKATEMMRNYFSKKGSIRQITNYGTLQLFDKIKTYTAILIFGKKEQENFLYQQAMEKNDFMSIKIPTDRIRKQKTWQLSMANGSTDGIHNTGDIKLKDICKIHVGLATLRDEAYIFPIQELDEKYVLALTKLKGKVKIERSILKPIVKVSTLKDIGEFPKTYILFPYVKVENRYDVISEETLKSDFPMAYEYLCSLKEILSKRNGEKPIDPWYSFGRSQGLTTSFGEKILFSPLNLKPNFILCNNEDSTFYSGYCIKYNGNYHKLVKLLNSKEMEDYINISSHSVRGGWKVYTKEIVGDFTINPDEL